MIFRVQFAELCVFIVACHLQVLGLSKIFLSKLTQQFNFLLQVEYIQDHIIGLLSPYFPYKIQDSPGLSAIEHLEGGKPVDAWGTSQTGSN